jgi:hypothetical protein
MGNLIKISIRIFLAFSILQLINNVSLEINNVVNQYRYAYLYSDEFLDKNLLKAYFPYICCWGIYLIIVVIIWIKSEEISKRVIGNNKIENINLLLNYENTLSLGIIVFGIYLFIDSLSKLISFISILFINSLRYEKNILLDFEIDILVQIGTTLLKIIASFIMIKYNEKIIKKIIKNKSNVA